jgi:hypothetical protein
MTQYCMALQQQSTPTSHASQQQRSASNNWRGLAQRNGNSEGGTAVAAAVAAGAVVAAMAVAAVAVAAAAAGAGAINSWPIHIQGQWADVRVTPPHTKSTSNQEILPSSWWQCQQRAHQ